MLYGMGRRIAGAAAAAAGAAVAGLATLAVSAFPAAAPVLAGIAVPLAVLSVVCFAYRLASAGAGWHREIWNARSGRAVKPYGGLW